MESSRTDNYLNVEKTTGEEVALLLGKFAKRKGSKSLWEVSRHKASAKPISPPPHGLDLKLCPQRRKATHSVCLPTTIRNSGRKRKLQKQVTPI